MNTPLQYGSCEHDPVPPEPRFTASHALADVHAAMNADMPVVGRQIRSCQTAFSLAFPFVAYVRAVSRYCREHDIERVFFLSREGFFFKRLFDATDRSGLQTHYLCVSRIALLMLTMEDLNAHAVDRILDLFEHHSHLDKVSVKQVLYILKIDDKAAMRIVRQLGLDAHRPMPFKENRDTFKSLLLDERMRTLFVRKRADYLAVFLRYLHRFDMLEAGNVLLCDMGWSGSMQTYLAGILKQQGSKVRLHGYYFGYDRTIDAKKHADRAGKLTKTGYFTYDGTPERLKEREIINNLSLEMLASAGHGTVVTYRDRRGVAAPVFKHIPEEIWQHRRFIRPFQDLIVRYAARHHARFDEIFRVFPSDDVYAYNRRITHALFHAPTPEFKRFLAFVFYDDFFGENVRILLAPYMAPSLRGRIRFGLRGVACRLARYVTPACLLEWLVADEIGGCNGRQDDGAGRKG